MKQYFSKEKTNEKKPNESHRKIISNDYTFLCSESTVAFEYNKSRKKLVEKPCTEHLDDLLLYLDKNAQVLEKEFNDLLEDCEQHENKVHDNGLILKESDNSWNSQKFLKEPETRFQHDELPLMPLNYNQTFIKRTSQVPKLNPNSNGTATIPEFSISSTLQTTKSFFDEPKSSQETALNFKNDKKSSNKKEKYVKKINKKPRHPKQSQSECMKDQNDHSLNLSFIEYQDVLKDIENSIVDLEYFSDKNNINIFFLKHNAKSPEKYPLIFSNNSSTKMSASLTSFM